MPADDRDQRPDDTAEQPVFRQELLPQEVKPGPRRTGLIVAIAVVLAVLVVGGVAFWLLGRDDDGGDRAAYCDDLRSATGDGDIAGALGSNDPAVLDELAAEAPDAVAGDWNELVRLRDVFQGGGDPSTSDAVAALTAVQSIVADADAECGITIDLPLP